MKRSDSRALLTRYRPEVWIGGLGVLLLATALLGFRYGVYPPLAQYRELSSQHSESEWAATATEMERTEEGIRSSRARVQTLRSELFGGSSAVPRRQIEAFVIDSLHRMSQAQGVQLMRVAPEEAAHVLMFEELPYDVRVRGHYFDLHRWLYEVEAELRPMVVKRFHLKPDRNQDAVELELRLVAYRLPGAEEPR